MSSEYLRYCSLIVSGQDGSGIDLSQLRIQFSVHDAALHSNRSLTARIYNLSQNTINAVMSKASSPGGAATTIKGVAFASGLQITLTAGYQDNYGVIFFGQVYQARVGKENNVDSYLDLFAADGDLNYNYALVNKTLAKGHSQLDVWNTCAQAAGVSAPTPPAMQPGTATRAKVLFGLVRETLRDHGVTNDINWQFRNGALQGATQDLAQEPLPPGTAIKLNSQTGLIGVPEQTQEGIKITALLNSNFQPNGLVQLTEADIVHSLLTLNNMQGGTPVDLTAGISTDKQLPPPAAPVGNDGLYRIILVGHQGDTRGNAWLTTLICTSADPTAQPYTILDAPVRGTQPTP